MAQARWVGASIVRTWPRRRYVRRGHSVLPRTHAARDAAVEILPGCGHVPHHERRDVVIVLATGCLTTPTAERIGTAMRPIAPTAARMRTPSRHFAPPPEIPAAM